MKAWRLNEPGYVSSFAVAAASVLVATLLRIAFDEYLGERGPFVTYFPAFAFCAWLGGLRSGFIAIALSLPVARYLFIEPRYTIGYSQFTIDNLPGAFLFFLASFLIIGSAEATRRSSRRRAEHELRETKDEFRAMFELSGIGMAQADPETGRLTRVNQHFANLTGYSVEEVLTKHYIDFTHPDDRDKDHDRFDDVIAGKRQHWEIEKRYVRKDGSIIWVVVNGTLVRDTAGRALRLNAHIQDVTDRVHAREALRFLSNATALLASSVELEETVRNLARLPVPQLADFCAVEMVAEDGSVEIVALSHRDPSKQEELLKLLEDCPRSANSPLLAPFNIDGQTRQLLETVESLPADNEFARAWRPCSLIVTPLTSRDHSIGRLILARMDSKTRYSEKDLELAVELSNRAAVAIENARLYRSVERTSDQKDQFLAMLAHELRNPMAAIGYAIQVAQAPASSKRDEALSIIERQASNLGRLIDDLLDVSRITRNKISLRCEVADAGELIRRAIATARPFIDQQRHELMVDLPGAPLTIFVDPTRIEQAVLNLLSNAAKYTPPGGRIQVSLSAEDGEVAIRVKDNGAGIPSEMLPHIFDLFTQVDHSLDRSQGGLGIGLTIVRSLVELHGGTVSVVSEGVNEGCEFCIRLPIAALLAASSPPPPITQPQCAPRRILIADDNVDTADASAMLLQSRGHTTHTTYDGASALAAAREFAPDVCLLDIGLPEMDGYMLCRELRSNGFENALLIAITGYGQPEDRRQSAEAGFDHHLTKPVSFSDLLALIATPREPR